MFLRSIVWLLFPASLLAADTEKTLPAPLHTKMAEFTLPNALDGADWSFVPNTREAKATVIVFLGTECPVSNQYAPVLARLAKTYAEKGVVFVGINSNQQDDAEVIRKHAKEYGLSFPILQDAKAVVADKFKAVRLPEAFVLDASRTVRYRGRIDDQYERSVKRPSPTSNDLSDALDAVLTGKDVARPVTTVVGCPISREQTPRVQTIDPGITYSKQVARIIQDHCQECHRPGEIGPFSLMNYKDAKNWSEAIREVVSENIMPPWHADPNHGSFANDRRLSALDKKTLLRWIDQGCPEGDAKDLPKPKPYLSGWNIGKPDEVLSMNQEQQIPAQTPKGGIPYKYVSVGKPFEEDKWVRAVEIRPGNRPVVHHVIVLILEPGMKLPNELGVKDVLGELFKDKTKKEPEKEPEWLAAYVPGDKPYVLPEGMARKIPKGCRLAFEIHYTPNGRAGTDRTSVGLIYSKEAPKTEVLGDMVINEKFAIPPGDANHRVTASFTFDREALLISMNPHMHVRGKSYQYKLITPDGKEEILLSVPKYDFNWQTTYMLSQPKAIPKGAKIECIAHYDNSENNPNNPDPKKKVRWGEQTWDEMMLGYFEYYVK